VLELGVAVDVGKFVLNELVPVQAFVPASVTDPPPLAITNAVVAN
jgi:hypothetical protein